MGLSNELVYISAGSKITLELGFGIYSLEVTYTGGKCAFSFDGSTISEIYNATYSWVNFGSSVSSKYNIYVEDGLVTIESTRSESSNIKILVI